MEERSHCASALSGSMSRIVLVKSRQSLVRFCSYACRASPASLDKFPMEDSLTSGCPIVSAISFCDIGSLLSFCWSDDNSTAGVQVWSIKEEFNQQFFEYWVR